MIICFPEDNFFTHSEFKSTGVSCIVAMLIGAIDALSGGLHMYFLMSELTGGTSPLSFCRVPYVTLMSRDVNQVGVALFSSFILFSSLLGIL